ncbi:MAG TPA: amidohydrolase family protein [Clostridia bacterium]|nr:amidohydrolase family protein [Clostridia bacterium]
MKIIDTHSHIYPQKIALKAKDNIGKFYSIRMTGVGATAEDLIASGEKIGVEKFVVHSTATKKEQVKSINNFIIDETQKHSEFIGFATLHPDMTEAEVQMETERILSAGLRGLKLHPDFQKFCVDDEKAFKIYEACEGRLPILFHAGDSRYEYSSPEKIVGIAKVFPKLTIIAAHFGGYTRWDETLIYKEVDNVYFDTSSTLFKLPADRAKKIIMELGCERFMFGVDFPMWRHDDELKRFLAVGLNDEINEAVLSKNAMRILNISEN